MQEKEKKTFAASIQLCTLEFLINVLHSYQFSMSLPFQPALIRNNMVIDFQEFFLQRCLFQTKIYWTNLFHSIPIFFPLQLCNNIRSLSLSAHNHTLSYRFCSSTCLLNFTFCPSNIFIPYNTFIAF